MKNKHLLSKSNSKRAESEFLTMLFTTTGCQHCISHFYIALYTWSEHPQSFHFQIWLHIFSPWMHFSVFYSLPTLQFNKKIICNLHNPIYTFHWKISQWKCKSFRRIELTIINRISITGKNNMQLGNSAMVYAWI